MRGREKTEKSRNICGFPSEQALHMGDTRPVLRRCTHLWIITQERACALSWQCSIVVRVMGLEASLSVSESLPIAV